MFSNIFVPTYVYDNNRGFIPQLNTYLQGDVNVGSSNTAYTLKLNGTLVQTVSIGVGLGPQSLYYNPTTQKITYSTIPSGGSGGTTLSSGSNFGDYLRWNPGTSSWAVGSSNVTIGAGAGQISQGANSIAIGVSAGYQNQISNSIILNATGADFANTAYRTISGFYVAPVRLNSTLSTLYYDPSSKEITFGNAPSATTLPSGINPGDYLYWNGSAYVVGDENITLGANAGQITQNPHAVAIGANAGSDNQGENSIAIGFNAGVSYQSSNSIILNATGVTLDTADEGFYVAPVRPITSTSSIYYNPDTKEITYGPVPGGGGGLNANVLQIVSFLDRTNCIVVSPDGLSWTEATVPTGFLGNSAVWTGSQWVAVGLGGDRNIITSVNGLDWNLANDGFSGGSYPAGNGVAWGGKRLVAVGQGTAGTILVSENGVDWFPAVTGFSGGVTPHGNGVAWNGSIWVAVGQGTDGTILTSGNGREWSTAAGGFVGGSGYGVAWNGSLWVAVGSGSHTILTSVNGLTWTPATSGGFVGGISPLGRAVAWNGSIWVAVGRGDNPVLTSTDGLVWDLPTVLNVTSFEGYGVTWVGTRWIATGDGEYGVITSTDGMSWDPVVDGVIGSTAGVAVASTYGLVLTSIRPATTSSSLFYNPATMEVTYGNALVTGTNYGNYLRWDPSSYAWAVGSTQVAIGDNAGATDQQNNAIAIGSSAGSIAQQQRAIAIGNGAGVFVQNPDAIAIGTDAGVSNQQMRGIAIGNYAGWENQEEDGIAIGYQAGMSGQQLNSIAIGYRAGNDGQTDNAVAIGASAGANGQGTFTVAIGSSAGLSGQLTGAIAVGANAGVNGQSNGSVAIGTSAAGNTFAGGQGLYSVALGFKAAYGSNTPQGDYSVAIGAYAGNSNQAANSIILNACAASLDAPTSGFFVNPVRSNVGPSSVYYNPVGGEFTYGPSPTPASGALFFLTVGSPIPFGTGTVAAAPSTFTLDPRANGYVAFQVVYMSGGGAGGGGGGVSSNDGTYGTGGGGGGGSGGNGYVSVIGKTTIPIGASLTLTMGGYGSGGTAGVVGGGPYFRGSSGLVGNYGGTTQVSMTGGSLWSANGGNPGNGGQGLIVQTSTPLGGFPGDGFGGPGNQGGYGNGNGNAGGLPAAFPVGYQTTYGVGGTGGTGSDNLAGGRGSPATAGLNGLPGCIFIAFFQS